MKKRSEDGDLCRNCCSRRCGCFFVSFFYEKQKPGIRRTQPRAHGAVTPLFFFFFVVVVVFLIFSVRSLGARSTGSVVIVVLIISSASFVVLSISLSRILIRKSMSTSEVNSVDEAISDLEKARCRRNRRPSVQFIDKNLIRRRSSGQEKPQAEFQPSRLPSIHGNDEPECADADAPPRDCESICRSNHQALFCRRRRRRKAPDFLASVVRHDDFLFLANASDTDSDAEDGTGPNIREMQHVSANEPRACLSLASLQKNSAGFNDFAVRRIKHAQYGRREIEIAEQGLSNQRD